MPQAMPVTFNKAFVVVPSDTVDQPPYKQQQGMGLTMGIYVGVTGNVAAVWEDTTVSTFVGVVAGTVLPIAVRRINATGTTATTMLALYQI